MPKIKFVSRSVWLVAHTEYLQRIKKKISTRKWPKKGRQRAKSHNFEKKKKIAFFHMSQGVLCQKIRFLGQNLWPVACGQTHRHTEVLTTEYPISASVFQASACDMSGPIKSLCDYIVISTLFFCFSIQDTEFQKPAHHVTLEPNPPVTQLMTSLVTLNPHTLGSAYNRSGEMRAGSGRTGDHVTFVYKPAVWITR